MNLRMKLVIRAEELIANKQWPCYFFKSDTTGEKDFEEFFTDNEDLDMSVLRRLGLSKISLILMRLS